MWGGMRFFKSVWAMTLDIRLFDNLCPEMEIIGKHNKKRR